MNLYSSCLSLPRGNKRNGLLSSFTTEWKKKKTLRLSGLTQTGYSLSKCSIRPTFITELFWIVQETFVSSLLSHRLPTNYILLFSLISPNHMLLTNKILVCSFMHNSVFLIFMCAISTSIEYQKRFQISCLGKQTCDDPMQQIKEFSITFSVLVLEEISMYFLA